AVEIDLGVAVATAGGGERREIPQRVAPVARRSLDIGPGEAPVKDRADRPLVALFEVGRECTSRLLRRLFIVDGGGASHEPRRAGRQASERNSRNHESSHWNPERLGARWYRVDARADMSQWQSGDGQRWPGAPAQ